ncbi:ABC-2 type transport system ATP-binding protein [Kineothrix alysoides]|uniref:ABC-2 type transport system ATP-binding protein n=1 Tax=Kineothrix alysoides TaxID=1469948 RepID=A0A4R1QX37_9FIRM|nr:ABC transporter ATP-binding protein [Kineothrix alysoides]TCL55974.1 ABC-2 type transport system ATP-binding protein [Kineothrix alysoides]
MEDLLKVEHLNKRVGEFCLKDISFSLKPGYIMGLLGVNGAGKTTLIHTILNLYKKDGGGVYVDDMEMEEEERAVKDKIGFVLDENMFEESMSVIRNAKGFGKLYSKFDEELFRIFCKNFGIPLNKTVGSLSTGMKVRFQLAFALSHDAVLFIMDEPAAGLDPLFRKELMRYMQEIVEDGTRSVLFSTHITEDLEKMSDYIVLMRDGAVFLSMPTVDLKERYRIVYGTKEQIETLPFFRVIYKEYGEYGSYAFLESTEGEDYGEYEVKEPLLEDIMYCLEKGGYSYV